MTWQRIHDEHYLLTGTPLSVKFTGDGWTGQIDGAPATIQQTDGQPFATLKMAQAGLEFLWRQIHQEGRGR